MVFLLESFVKLMSKNSISGHEQVKKTRHFAVVCQIKPLSDEQRIKKTKREREGGTL
jgi:hypothetical protein